MTQGHTHAISMALYAQDAAEHSQPWTLWEKSLGPNDWWTCVSHPAWAHGVQYRRKPRTIRIGEFEVPEPLRVAPVVGTEFFTPRLDVWGGSSVNSWVWDEHSADHMRLSAGLCHLTRDAAEQHARALLSLSAPR